MDGLVQFEKINAIFNDRLTIIHNQKYLDNLINKQFERIDNKISSSSTRSQAHNNGMQIKMADHNEQDVATLMTITLELQDLYIFLALSISCCISCILIGILIGKCIYGSGVNAKFSPVPKYDYATSDFEDAKDANK